MISLSRLGKNLNHALNVEFGRIGAVVRKPRIFFVGARSLGAPVFTADGRILGICVARKPSKSGGAMGLGAMMRGGATVSVTPVILPAEDIRDIAALAKEEMTKEKK